jgi:chemotaxis signal transduction protein
VDLVDELSPQLVLVGRVGGLRFAWLIGSVERVLPRAEITRVSSPPPGFAGLLDVHGDLLAVVDPRQQLGLPPTTARPDQHLMLMANSSDSGSGRYLLWVDAIENIVSATVSAFAPTPPASEGMDGVPRMIRVDGELVRVLSAASFQPDWTPQPTRGSG